MEIHGSMQPRNLPVAPQAIEGTLPSASREVQQGGIREAAESFASYLYAQVFAKMRPEESEEEGGMFSGEQAGMFMDFFDQALGKQFVAQGGNSLVDQLVTQLSHEQAVKPIDSAKVPTAL